MVRMKNRYFVARYRAELSADRILRGMKDEIGIVPFAIISASLNVAPLRSEKDVYVLRVDRSVSETFRKRLKTMFQPTSISNNTRPKLTILHVAGSRAQLDRALAKVGRQSTSERTKSLTT